MAKLTILDDGLGGRVNRVEAKLNGKMTAYNFPANTSGQRQARRRQRQFETQELQEFSLLLNSAISSIPKIFNRGIPAVSNFTLNTWEPLDVRRLDSSSVLLGWCPYYSKPALEWTSSLLNLLASEAHDSLYLALLSKIRARISKTFNRQIRGHIRPIPKNRDRPSLETFIARYYADQLGDIQNDNELLILHRNVLQRLESFRVIEIQAS